MTKAYFRVMLTAAVIAILVLSVAPLASSQSTSGAGQSTPGQSQPAAGQPQWLNGSQFRAPIVVANPTNTTQVFAPVLFYLNFPWGEVVNANNELIIQDSAGNTVNSTVLCQTVERGFVVGACVLMAVNMTGTSADFYAYYGNPAASQKAVSVAPSNQGATVAAIFSGLDLGYTFYSTYGLNYSSYLSIQGTPNEGSSNLDAYPYQIVSPWHFLGAPFTSLTTSVATASADDSGVLVLRTMVGTSSSLHLLDLIVNQRSTVVSKVSMVDFYDLSDIDKIFPGAGTYNSSLSEFTYTSADATFQMTSNPAPYPVEVGAVGSVLNDTRDGDFSSVQSAAGVIGMANVHSFSSIQPSDSEEIVRNWAVGNVSSTQLPFVASVEAQQSLGSIVPAVFEGYDTSFSVDQNFINYVSLAKNGLSFMADNGTTISTPIAPTFSGPITYEVPDQGSSNFSDPTAWSTRATSVLGISTLASDKYYSAAEGSYTGLVSLTATNTSAKAPIADSVTMTTVPLDVAGFQNATLHLTYRAVDTIPKPNNRTSLYFAIGTPGQQGNTSETYYFPVPGLSSNAFHGNLEENLTADGQWHELSSNIGTYLPSQISSISMTLNATATNSESGTLQLQVSGAYVTVSGSAALVLGGTLSQKGNLGSLAVALTNPEMSLVGNATMEIPYWVAGSPQTATGSNFTVNLMSQTASLIKGTNRTASYAKGTITGQSLMIFGPNSSLSSAMLNGNVISPVSTDGGYVVSGFTGGSGTLSFGYKTVPYKVAVEDASGNPLSVSFAVNDKFGAQLLNTTIPVGGTTLNLIPGTYTLSATFDGFDVMTSTVTITVANATTIHASVYREGFQVNDALGSPIPYASVTLKLQSSPESVPVITSTGVADGSGKVYFEMVQNGYLQGSYYTITVSSGGSTLTTQIVSANVNGALIAIPTGYTPPSIIEFVIITIIWIVLVVTLVPRLLRRTSLAPKFMRRSKTGS